MLQILLMRKKHINNCVNFGNLIEECTYKLSVLEVTRISGTAQQAYAAAAGGAAGALASLRLDAAGADLHPLEALAAPDWTQSALLIYRIETPSEGARARRRMRVCQMHDVA